MAASNGEGNIEKHAVGGEAAENSERRKPGGWKTIPFILVNETFERLATFSLLANFMVYLRREYHMNQVDAANLINMWMGISNFAPLIGAFFSDAYFGRFRVIAASSFASLLGMLTLILTAWIPSLRPPKCPNVEQCVGPGPSRAQLGILISGLAFLSIGSGGIRPCSIPFGVDQFDFSTEEGRRGINSYYNWYYATFTVVLMFSLTVMVYIQDSFSWVVGFGIPTTFMVCSIIVFFIGTRLYVYVAPEGSIFSSVAQTLVAAFRKRRLQLPGDLKDKHGVFFDSPFQGVAVSKLPLTNEFRFLNKAAIIKEGEVKSDGRCWNKWRLSSIQQIEEVKCLIRVIPVWASGIICMTAAMQQWTFTVSQALVMDRHFRKNGGFAIPAGSIQVVSMLAVAIWVPVYDRLVVPALRKLTHHEEGMTLLQRMGIGLVLSVAAMVVAGAVEKQRRELMVTKHIAMSVFRLAPQLVLLGLSEAFNFIGQIEFYNKQFPENMSSIATSLFFVAFGGASYLSSILIGLVHGLTHGRGPRNQNWLADPIDQGRLDYFYYLLALLGVLNFIYFLVVSVRYRYKYVEIVDNKVANDLELSQVKY